MTEAGSGSDKWFYKLDRLLLVSYWPLASVLARLWRWSVQVLLQAGISRSLQS